MHTDSIFLEPNQDNTTAVLAALVDQNRPMRREKGEVHDRIVPRVPPSVSASSSNNVGLIRTAEPVRILLKHNASLPVISHYPLSQEKREGIRTAFQSLLNFAIIVPCNSPCNTPIFSVKKPAKPEHRFVQDLKE